MSNDRFPPAAEFARSLTDRVANGEIPVALANQAVTLLGVDAADREHHRYRIATMGLADILYARSALTAVTQHFARLLQSVGGAPLPPEGQALAGVLLIAKSLDDQAVERLKALAAVTGVIVTIVGDSTDDDSPEVHHYYLTPVLEGPPRCAAAGAARH